MCLFLKILAIVVLAIVVLFFIGIVITLSPTLLSNIKSKQETTSNQNSLSLEHQNDEYDYGHNVPHHNTDYMGYWDF